MWGHIRFRFLFSAFRSKSPPRQARAKSHLSRSRDQACEGIQLWGDTGLWRTPCWGSGRRNEKSKSKGTTMHHPSPQCPVPPTASLKGVSECGKESKKRGWEVSGAKLRCFSKFFFTCFYFLILESITRSSLIGNEINWLKFLDTKLGFLAHDRKKLPGSQKNMGCWFPWSCWWK